MSKVVIVTGANKGIGRSIIERLIVEAPEFGTIVMTSRDQQLGLRAKSELELKFGPQPRLHYCSLDVTSESSIIGLTDYIRQVTGKVNVFINNAGIAFKGNDFGPHVVSPTFACNFYGLINTTEAILPFMTDDGHIINVTSFVGRTRILPNQDLANRFLAANLTRPELMELALEFLESVNQGDWTQKGWPTQAYGVSKVCANAYTRILAKELKEKGSRIRVNALHPGWVRTDMAGPNAPLSPEEGAITPVFLAKHTGEESGLFWFENTVHGWN